MPAEDTCATPRLERVRGRVDSLLEFSICGLGDLGEHSLCRLTLFLSVWCSTDGGNTYWINHVDPVRGLAVDELTSYKVLGRGASRAGSLPVGRDLFCLWLSGGAESTGDGGRGEASSLYSEHSDGGG